MQITKELVKYVADLSKIKLNTDQIDKMQSELSAIINYMDILNKIDTENVEPLSHIFSIINVMRDDVVGDSYPIDLVLGNLPDKSYETFTVPKTIEEV